MVLAWGAIGCGSDPTSAAAPAEDLAAAALVTPADLGAPEDWRVADARDDLPSTDLTAAVAARCADPASYDEAGNPEAAVTSDLLEAVPERSAFWASEGAPEFTGLVRAGVAVYPDEASAAAAAAAIGSDALRACIGEQVTEVVAQREAEWADDTDWPVAPAEAVGDMGRVTPTVGSIEVGDDGALVETSFDAAVVGGLDHSYAADLAVVRRATTLVLVTAAHDSQGIDRGPVAATAGDVAATVVARVDQVLAGEPLPTSTTVDEAARAAASDAAIAAMVPQPARLPDSDAWMPAPTTPMAQCLELDTVLTSTGSEPPVAVAAPTSVTGPGAEVVVSGAVYADRAAATGALSGFSQWVQCPLWDGAASTGWWATAGRPEVGDDTSLLAWQAQPTAAPGTARGAYDLLAVRRGRAIFFVATYEDVATPESPPPNAPPTTGPTALEGAVLDQADAVDRAVAAALD